MMSTKVFLLLLVAVAVAVANDDEGTSGEASHEGHGHRMLGQGGHGRHHFGSRYGFGHRHGGQHSENFRDHHPDEAEESHAAHAAQATGDHHDAPLAKDCGYVNHTQKSGVQHVQPEVNGKPMTVLCDMATDGGGWTVLSRRQDGSVNFTRTWAEYVLGFGSLKGEFWIGLEAMHQLTESGLYELRVDAETTDGGKKHVNYGLFHVRSRDDDYRLDLEGFNGTISNMLAPNNRQQFSAWDRTTPTNMHKCALALHGGWWFSSCQSNSPNGIYVKQHDPADLKYGLAWHRPDGTTVWGKSFEMKIRPAHTAF